MPRDFDDYNDRDNDNDYDRNGRGYDRDYDRNNNEYSDPRPFGIPGIPGFYPPGRPFGGSPQGPQRPQRPQGPSQGPGRGQMPPGPPPQRAPRRGMDRPRSGVGQPSVFIVDPGAIRGCLYRFTYIWLENGRSFWAWLTFIGRNSVAGYRWTGNRWVYFGTDLNNISDFECF